MIQLIKRKIPEFFHPSANSLSIRCKCGEMSYCVRLLLTCLCVCVGFEHIFLLKKFALCIISCCAYRESIKNPESFLKLFSHPFFRECENIDAFFVNNGFVNSQTRLRNLHLHISDGIFDHQYSGMLFLAWQKLWNCIEEGSKNENQKWNRPKVMVFQLCTYKAK